MSETISILFLSANPWTTSRILVDEEASEIFDKLQEGPDRERFILHTHAAVKPADVQRLLMTYRPHIVHFSGHSSKKQKIILGGVPGRGKQINRQALVDMFALYRQHVRLVFLNACFTRNQASSLAEVVDYSIGSRKPIGDKEGVALAAAFYRALGFGKSVKEAFESAKAELALANMTRAKGVELFVRNGVPEDDQFPHSDSSLRNQITESPQRTCQYLPDEADNQYRGALTPANINTAIGWEPIDLQPQPVPNHAGEAIQREQLILTYECTRHVSDPRGRIASDSIMRSSTVRVFLKNVNKVRGTQSNRSLNSSKSGLAPVAITCASTAVTIEQRLLTLSQPRAKCQRIREDRGVRALEANRRGQRKPRARRQWD